ncbi:MAG: alpha-ribazole phosphatase CobZ [Methanosarcinaceae archaeon]|nr:alpha-ribazole phosphatase CobZ [Methanosarcinaceae archaeon]
MNKIAEKKYAIEKVLAEEGISYDSLLKTALEFYVPHPGIETEEKAAYYFRREYDYALSDPNVSLLIYSAVLLEREGKKGNLPDLSKESYEKDMTFIIADEVLGESLAEYIGGHKGKFEFVRFDKNKPGILKELGPFIDDIIGGLLGGISANMYSRAGFEKEYECK